MDVPVPKKIGRYVVDRLLGSGAMGNVYLGRDPELDRPVAIKVVRDLGLPKDRLETFLTRFRNEARAAARLHDKTIVQVYDVGQDAESGPYVVFEYVAGSTLKQILRSRGPYEPTAAVRLAEQVATALDLAHEQEIIHRDVKPDNLLITPNGDAKLADFGVARVPNAALTREGQFLGTPCYAAPETLAEGRYGPQSDIFSFAALLYEVVSGERAFPGDDAVAVAHKVIHEEPPPPSEVSEGRKVPPEIDAVLMRGLSKKADARPKSARELAEAFRAAYESTGTIASGELAPPRARSSGGGEPARGSAGVFLALLGGGLAVGVGLVFAFDDSPRPPDTLLDDGGYPGIDAGHTVRPLELDAGVLDAGILDTGVDAMALDAALPDAGGAEPLPGDCTRARDECAKEALDDARRLIEAGDLAGARRQVALARQYDPGEDDIPEVERLIEQAEQRQAPPPPEPPPP